MSKWKRYICTLTQGAILPPRHMCCLCRLIVAILLSLTISLFLSGLRRTKQAIRWGTFFGANQIWWLGQGRQCKMTNIECMYILSNPIIYYTYYPVNRKKDLKERERERKRALTPNDKLANLDCNTSGA